MFWQKALERKFNPKMDEGEMRIPRPGVSRISRLTGASRISQLASYQLLEESINYLGEMHWVRCDMRYAPVRCEMRFSTTRPNMHGKRRVFRRCWQEMIFLCWEFSITFALGKTCKDLFANAIIQIFKYPLNFTQRTLLKRWKKISRLDPILQCVERCARVFTHLVVHKRECCRDHHLWNT